MPLFKTILYPTDFSDLSEVAKEYVIKLKEANAKKVVLVHVIHPLEFSLPQFDDPFVLDVAAIYAQVPELERKILKSHEDMLKKVKDELEGKGFEVKTIMTVGDPKDEILKVAESEKVDLIVVGYHGKGLMERILEMGSTAKAIIRKASCPVLVVKRKEQ